MAYWPVAFFIVLAGCYIVIQMLKHNPELFIKALGCGFGVGALIALLASGSTSGFSLLIFFVVGIVATVIGCVVCWIWENA